MWEQTVSQRTICFIPITCREDLAERVGFEPTVEFPLHTLSKRARSTTPTSLRFRIKKLRTVWNSVAQNPPSNRPLPSSLSESASCERGKGPVVRSLYGDLAEAGEE